MKPVHQNRFGGGDADRPPGNCFAACLASILEITLDDLPWPRSDERESWVTYWPRLAGVLAGYGVVEVAAAEPIPVRADAHMVHPLVWVSNHDVDVFMVAIGPGPRGHEHSVVINGAGRVVHDPHPDGTGLLSVSHLSILVPVSLPGRSTSNAQRSPRSDSRWP